MQGMQRNRQVESTENYRELFPALVNHLNNVLHWSLWNFLETDVRMLYLCSNLGEGRAKSDPGLNLLVLSAWSIAFAMYC